MPARASTGRAFFYALVDFDCLVNPYVVTGSTQQYFVTPSDQKAPVRSACVALAVPLLLWFCPGLVLTTWAAAFGQRRPPSCHEPTQDLKPIGILQPNALMGNTLDTGPTAPVVNATSKMTFGVWK